MISQRLSSTEVDIQENRWKKSTRLLFALTVFFLILNGLHNSYINLCAILFAILFVLFSNEKETLCLYPVLFIYFDFSNLTMNLPGMNLDISTVRNLLFLLMSLKILFIKHALTKTNSSLLFSIMTIWCSLNILFTDRLSQAVYMAAKLYIVYEILECLNGNSENIDDDEDDLFKLEFISCFFLAIIGEVLYGVIFSTYREYSYSTWRSLQFNGVRDPNNLALHCCFLFAIALIVYKPRTLRILKVIIGILMPIIVLATISFTGITMMLFLLIVLTYKELNGRKRFIFVGILLFLIIISVLIDYGTLLLDLTNSNISFISGLGQRLNTMLTQYSSGNYERLTSGRTALWKEYWNYFKDENIWLQLVGREGTYRSLLQQIGTASHNSYIDYLISYGIIGVIIIGVIALYTWVNKIRNGKIAPVLINIMFAITFFSRTFDLPHFLMYVLA